MRGALAAFALVMAVAGCAGGAGEDEGGRKAAPTAREQLPEPEEPALRPACTPGDDESLIREREAYAAYALGRMHAFARPEGKRIRTFGRLNVNGVPTVFSVLGVIRDSDCNPLWYRVQLPIRPNGAIGYVRADKVGTYRVRTRIEVDLSARRIVFYRGGKRVLTVTAAIGSSATPTPTGRYYVNQRLLSGDPSGPFGPGAIGISAFSPVLTGWAQGGPIAIHGTNQPWSIGQPISNGCMRVPNDVLKRLFAATPVGTPVLIEA